MPNWITNGIEISGPKAEVAEIMRLFAQKDPFSAILPCPKELFQKNMTPEQRADNKAKYGHEDWYSLTSSNWGTKWDTEVLELKYSPTYLDNAKLSIVCETANDPCFEILVHLSERFPSVWVNVDAVDNRGHGGFVATIHRGISKGRSKEDWECIQDDHLFFESALRDPNISNEELHKFVDLGIPVLAQEAEGLLSVREESAQIDQEKAEQKRLAELRDDD